MTEREPVHQKINTELESLRAILTQRIRPIGEHPEAVVLQALLLARDMTEYKMEQCRARPANRGLIEPTCGHGSRESGEGAARAESDRIGARDHLCTIPVCQQRVAERRSLRARPALPIAPGGRGRHSRRMPIRDAVRQFGDEGLLVLEMPVKGAGLHTERGCETTHREIGEPVVIEDAQRRVGNIVAPIPSNVSLITHKLTIVNDVQVNTVQEDYK